jgi:hypothetical protein
MHRRCTQVHENALRPCSLCIGVGIDIGIGIGVGIEPEPDTESDPEVIQTLNSFSKQIRHAYWCSSC